MSEWWHSLHVSWMNGQSLKWHIEFHERSVTLTRPPHPRSQSLIDMNEEKPYRSENDLVLGLGRGPLLVVHHQSRHLPVLEPIFFNAAPSILVHAHLLSIHYRVAGNKLLPTVRLIISHQMARLNGPDRLHPLLNHRLLRKHLRIKMFSRASSMTLSVQRRRNAKPRTLLPILRRQS